MKFAIPVEVQSPRSPHIWYAWPWTEKMVFENKKLVCILSFPDLYVRAVVVIVQNIMVCTLVWLQIYCQHRRRRRFVLKYSVQGFMQKHEGIQPSPSPSPSVFCLNFLKFFPSLSEQFTVQWKCCSSQHKHQIAHARHQTLRTPHMHTVFAE